MAGSLFAGFDESAGELIEHNGKLVKEYFGYSDSKAVDALSILTEDQLVMIKEKLFKGGK